MDGPTQKARITAQQNFIKWKTKRHLHRLGEHLVVESVCIKNTLSIY